MPVLPDELLSKHNKVTHSENKKVLSHIQREFEEWFVNTLMLEDCEVPFKYRRKKRYKSLKGQNVNVTYYPDFETLAGFDIEIMRVIRLRRS